MGDLPEFLKGVRPGFRKGKQVYFFFDLPKTGEQLLTIGQIAERFVLTPDKVLDALTLSSPRVVAKQNAWATEALYQEQGLIWDDGLGLTTVPSALRHPPRHSAGEKRTILRNAARTTSWDIKGRTAPKFASWTVSCTDTLALPLSRSFRTSLQRYQKYKRIEPEVAAFTELVERLASDFVAMRDAMREIADAAREAQPEVAALVALNTIADLSLDQLGNPGPGDHPIADFQNFLVSSALPIHVERLMREPAAASTAIGRRDRAAGRILDALKQRSWLDGMRLLVDNVDLIEHVLWDRVYYYLEASSTLLPMTGHADRFYEEQLTSMAQGLAEMDLPPAMVQSLRENLPAETAESLIDGASGARRVVDSVYKLAVPMALVTITVVSNMPGPQSLAVASFNILLFHGIASGATNPLLQAAKLTAALQLACRVGNLTEREIATLTRALKEAMHLKGRGAKFERVSDLLGVNWEDRVMRSSRLRGGTVLFCGLILVATLRNDPLSSWENVGGVLSAAGGTALSIADFAPVGVALQKHAPALAATGAKGLSATLGLLGICLGASTAIRGMRRGDKFQVAEGVLGASGSAIALAGWSATALAVPVPVPHYFMALGAVLIVTSTTIAIVGLIAPPGPEEFIYAVLAHLSDEESRSARAGLTETITVLKQLADDCHFTSLPSDTLPELRSRGFADNIAIGLIDD